MTKHYAALDEAMQRAGDLVQTAVGAIANRALEQRKRNRAAMKKNHDARRAAGVCINNPAHGASFKGGRCKICWDTKKAAEKAAYELRAAKPLPTQSGVAQLVEHESLELGVEGSTPSP